ncbi:hypothetical protein NC797_18295 [Aquibacillus sp. 3ASR75-11]|uniref:Uncharacterized protein n=1 Tax=Terrihalobacillus insolitus TaxID=2950438 RepID=A0A9X3WY33_9BACI|nr:hypothetical protein [Terrihalobacillus insolitus]MDC3415290.1 hypothetical protein [Terrihalobacillus insolitus]MDC3426391.1 hypothetical protein [Terrihalobacillus insolitus]
MKKAQELWNQIPEWAREKLIHNVFCTSCSGVTTIIDYEIEMAGFREDIVLRGKCQKCGHEVARYIERD